MLAASGNQISTRNLLHRTLLSVLLGRNTRVYLPNCAGPFTPLAGLPCCHLTPHVNAVRTQGKLLCRSSTITYGACPCNRSLVRRTLHASHFTCIPLTCSMINSLQGYLPYLFRRVFHSAVAHPRFPELPPTAGTVHSAVMWRMACPSSLQASCK